MKAKTATGSIYKSGKKFYIVFRANGERKTIRLNADTIEEAEADAAKYRKIVTSDDIDEIAFFAAKAKKEVDASSKKMSLESAFELFFDSPARPPCGEKQLKAHRRNWEKFSAAQKVRHIENLTREDAERYFSALNARPSAFNKALHSCRLIYRTLLPDAKNIFRSIEEKTEAAKSKKEFSAAQIRALFSAVDREYPLAIPHRNELSALFRVLTYTGMRLKDGTLLDWKDIRGDIIKVTPNKTRRFDVKVELPIHPALAPFLADRQESGPVFPGLTALYSRGWDDVDKLVLRVIDWTLGEKAFYLEKGVKKTKRSARLKEYGAHSFRHAFISFQANAGTPMEVVRAIVGHTSVAVTRIYTHISEESKRRVIASMPEI